ncbi:MAG: DNA-processing protein DprA [Coxiellaceae bacterium]|nr:DNA-processing protein DprA [Coxiellaceae bacterium]
MIPNPEARQEFTLKLSMCWHIPYNERLLLWNEFQAHPHLLSHNAQQAFNTIKPQQLDDGRKWLLQAGHHLLSCDDVNYPPLLKEIYRPPLTLYICGQLSLLQSPQVAIVGSRNPSHAGRANAYRFSHQLANLGYTITSGLAMGIDAEAHKAAIDQQAPTIAVLGCGIDQVYPRRNQRLYQQIPTIGALVSEYPLGTAPQAKLFPQRNRLISGLSFGVLVVEAAERSGSLITARLALEQGREVFAVPGALANPMTRGCHKLIKQGAKLVECTEDIVVELPAIELCKRRVSTTDCKKSIQNNNSGLDAHCRLLLECLQSEAVSKEQLLYYSKLSPKQITQSLVKLELQGKIKHENGRYYRVRTA